VNTKAAYINSYEISNILSDKLINGHKTQVSNGI